MFWRMVGAIWPSSTDACVPGLPAQRLRSEGPGSRVVMGNENQDSCRTKGLMASPKPETLNVVQHIVYCGHTNMENLLQKTQFSIIE